MSDTLEDPGEEYRGLAGTTEEGLAGVDGVTVGQGDEAAELEADQAEAPYSPLFRPVPRHVAAHRRAFGAGIREGDDDDHHDDEVPAHLRRYLTAGEQHATVLPLHPFAMGSVDLCMVGALACAITLHVLAYAHGLAYPPVVKTIWLLFAAVLGWWAWQLAEFRSTWIVITPARILVATRFPTTKVVSLPWRRTRDVELTQTMIGRAMGYGSLQLLSIGTDHALARVDYVPRADRTYRLIWSILQPTHGKSPMMPEVEW